MFEVEMIRTNQDKPAIIYDAFLFILKKEGTRNVTWRCNNRGCKAKASSGPINNFDTIHATFTGIHNHNSDESNIIRRRCILKMKRLCHRLLVQLEV